MSATLFAVLCTAAQSLRANRVAHGRSGPCVKLEDYAAVCCAIQNLSLSLHAAGVSLKVRLIFACIACREQHTLVMQPAACPLLQWSTGGVTRKTSFRELVGAQRDEMVVGVLMCGYRATNAPRLRPPIKRRPLVAVNEASRIAGCPRQEDEMTVFDFRACAESSNKARRHLPVLSVTD